VSYLGLRQATIAEFRAENQAELVRSEGRRPPPIVLKPFGPILFGMGFKVLIVDDSMVARLAIKGIVKDSVDSLAEASSGEAALDLLAGGREPDLVFLDLTMPGMGGIEALKAIRSGHPSVKVAVVTADIQARTLAEVRACGAYEVIRKPADRAAVLALVSRARGEGAAP